MAAFERFRQQNVTDLILDLRYNNGGDVLSSAVLGTLVAGNDYKGQVYAHTTFNEDRTEAGEGGDYKIGVKETVERIYEPLETALQHAVGLKKIYLLVSQTTASASEMVINGLRRLDIEVNLIGQTTNGKNVGIEGRCGHSTIMSSCSTLLPFTLRTPKGSGIIRRVLSPMSRLTTTAIYPGEFGTMEDQLGYIALVSIKSGKKPELQASSLTRGGGSPMKPFGELVGYPSHTSRSAVPSCVPGRTGSVPFHSYAAEASVQGAFALFISVCNFFVEKTPLLRTVFVISPSKTHILCNNAESISIPLGCKLNFSELHPCPGVRRGRFRPRGTRCRSRYMHRQQLFGDRTCRQEMP